MTPKTELSAATPVRLRGKNHAYGAATWKRMIKLYQEVDGRIVTAFDYDLLLKYCLLEEEIVELENMRRTMKADWESNAKIARSLPKPKDADSSASYSAFWEIVSALYGKFQGLDARLDGKRKLLHTLSQSLYLTPRSRAGVAPAEKEAKRDDDPMADLLDK